MMITMIMMMIMTMILPGTAAVCSISTSKMWPECPSKDIGRSELIAEGEDDNHHFYDDKIGIKFMLSMMVGVSYYHFHRATVGFTRNLSILTKIVHFRRRSPFIAFLQVYH